MADPASLLKAACFAARKHRDQRRKDAEAAPYINHALEVANLLAAEGAVTDETLLVSALLHDTVEDTETSFAELEQQFGAPVCRVVQEVTDDKTLPKAERKQLQIEHAVSASDAAKQLKIADKICNIRDVVHHPPEGWSRERRVEYLQWATEVVRGCRGVNEELDRMFDDAMATAGEQLGRGKIE